MTWGNPPPFIAKQLKKAKAVTPEQIAGISEGSHQKAVMVWAAMNFDKYPQLKYLFHIPNGGSRDIREAVELKAQGVKAGVPDLMLPWPKYPYHGLFIELKIKTGKVSEDQKKWIDYLLSIDYKAVVCWSWEEAKNELENYLCLAKI